MSDVLFLTCALGAIALFSILAAHAEARMWHEINRRNGERRELQRAVVLFRQCKWGPFSKPDSDGKLQPVRIREILVGINSKENSTAKMAVDGLEWVRF